MSTDIESLVVKFDVNLSEFNRKMNKAEKECQSFGKNIETAGKKASNNFFAEINNVIKKVNPVKQIIDNTFKSLNDKLSNSFDLSGLINTVDDISTGLGFVSDIKDTIENFGDVFDLFKKGGKAVDVVTDATKTAAGAMGTFEAASGPIALALGAIITIVVALIAACSNTSEEIKELKDDADELAKSIEEQEGKFKDTTNSIADNASAASNLKDQLTALNSKENKTNADKEKMVALVGQLNKLYPDMGLSIDSATGALSMSNEELEASVENMKNQVKMAAISDAYTKALQDQAEAQRQIGESTTALNDAKKASADYWASSGIKWVWDASTHDNNINTATQALEENKTSLEAASEAVEFYEGEMTKLSTTLATTSAATSALDDYSQDQIQNMKDMGYSYDELAAKNSDSLDRILSDWQDNQDKMKELLDERVEMTQNAFSTIDKTANEGITYDTMLENMESNRTDMETWRSNLSTLKTKGLDPKYIQELVDMGIGESYNAVQALITKTEEEGFVDFKEFNDSLDYSEDVAYDSVYGTNKSTEHSESEKQGTSGSSSSSSNNTTAGTTSAGGTTSQSTGTTEGTNIADTVQNQFATSDFTSTGAKVVTDFIAGMESMREPLVGEVDSLMGDIVNKLTMGASSSESDSKDGASTESAGAAASTNIATEIQNQILSVDYTATGATVMTNFIAGMESMREPLMDKVASLLDSIVSKLTGISFVVKVDPQRVKVKKNAKGGIRYHAEGGITNGPTVMDIMGEAGAEALLPLESNTGWMDKIADKVAAKMGSLKVDFTVNTPVTLDGATIAASQTKQSKILNLQTGAAVMGGI